MQQRFNICVAAIFALLFTSFGMGYAFYSKRFVQLRDANDDCLDPLIIKKSDGSWIPFWTEPSSLYDLYDKVNFNNFEQSWVHNVIPTFDVSLNSTRDPSNINDRGEIYDNGNEDAPFMKQLKKLEDGELDQDSCTNITAADGQY